MYDNIETRENGLVSTCAKKQLAAMEFADMTDVRATSENFSVVSCVTDGVSGGGCGDHRQERTWSLASFTHDSQLLQSLQMTLSENMYNSKKVSDWTHQVIDACMKGLQALKKPFKYIGRLHCCTMRTCSSTVNSNMHHHTKDRRWNAHSSHNVLGLKEGRYVALSAVCRC